MPDRSRKWSLTDHLKPQDHCHDFATEYQRSVQISSIHDCSRLFAKLWSHIQESSCEGPRPLTTVVSMHHVFNVDAPRISTTYHNYTTLPVWMQNDLSRIITICPTNHHDCTTIALRLFSVHSDVRPNRTYIEKKHEWAGLTRMLLRRPQECRTNATRDTFEYGQTSRDSIPMRHEQSRILATPPRYYDCCRRFISWLVGNKIVTVTGALRSTCPADDSNPVLSMNATRRET